jgi:hypothetical protein
MKSLRTAPIRRMFATLADFSPRGKAFATVTAMIDMGLLSPEVLTDVVLGAVTISRAMADLAEVMDDAAADDDEETRADMERIAADCRSAAGSLALEQPGPPGVAPA